MRPINSEMRSNIFLVIFVNVLVGFLTFSFGSISSFLIYPTLNVFPFLVVIKEEIAGLGLIIPTILAGWLLSLVLKRRGLRSPISSLGMGIAVALFIFIARRFLSFFPENWLIYSPLGMALVVVAACLGGMLSSRGKSLLYVFSLFFIIYSFILSLKLYIFEISSKINSYYLKVPGSNITLGATLTLPKSNFRLKFPGVILIPGSGRQDRDNTFGIFNATFKEMAEFLSEKGFAVVRYDVRGVGQSSGDFSSAGLFDFADDAESIFLYLRLRKEIDPSRIFLIGHSYGGKVATIVASEHPEVAGLILLACVASPEPDNLLRQHQFISRMKGESEEEKKNRLQALNSWIEKVKDYEYQTYSDYFGEKGLSPEFQMTQRLNPFPPIWLRQAMEYDQLKTIGKLKMPVLVISGTSDWMVPPSETELLENALKKAGHPDFEVKIFSQVDHRFIQVKTQEESYWMMSLFSIKYLFRQYPLHRPVLEEILSWLVAKEESDI